MGGESLGEARLRGREEVKPIVGRYPKPLTSMHMQPILSCHYPILFYPILSYPAIILSYSILSYPTLPSSYPILSYPILPCHYPILSYPKPDRILLWRTRISRRSLSLSLSLAIYLSHSRPLSADNNKSRGSRKMDESMQPSVARWMSQCSHQSQDGERERRWMAEMLH